MLRCAILDMICRARDGVAIYMHVHWLVNNGKSKVKVKLPLCFN